MEPVFNQALKAGHDRFVTDTYIQFISSSLGSLTNIITEDNLGVLFNTDVCLLNGNNIGQIMGEKIYNHTLFNTL